MFVHDILHAVFVKILACSDNNYLKIIAVVAGFLGFSISNNTTRYSQYELTFTKVYISTVRSRLLGDTIKRFNIMPIIGTSQPHILTVNFKRRP